MATYLMPSGVLADLERESEAAREVGEYRMAGEWDRAAEIVREACQEHATEPITVREAAEETGYSERSIRRLLADDEVPNVGRKRAPRVRRVDLPRKPGAGLSAPDASLEGDTDSLVALQS